MRLKAKTPQPLLSPDPNDWHDTVGLLFHGQRGNDLRAGMDGLQVLLPLLIIR